MSSILLLFLAIGHAEDSSSRMEKSLAGQDLNTRLERILAASPVAQKSLGLSVVDLSHAPQVQVYGLNEQKEFIPASITKLATAAAVLKRLGPSFKFQTTVCSAGAVKSGTLHGDVVLKGGGDTGFVSESMWSLANEFARTGIRKIEGDVVVDDSDFDKTRADPSRDSERVDRAYDAPVGAMSFNWNSVNIYVRPTQVGQKPQVYLDPLTDYYQVENKAKTVNGLGVALEVSRSGQKVVVKGTIGLSHDEFVAYKNIDDPADWSGKNLAFFLEQRGIRVTGEVRAGKKSESCKLLAKTDSKPITQHIADMMKFSNNYIAEMLTKDLAVQSGVIPGTLEGGMKIIRANLAENMGLDSKRYTLVNPSGLSRHNLMRARDLAEILVQANRNFPYFAEFLSALPIAGNDGTLKKRMLNSAATGWVRAKTGSMSGIVSLAGYAGRKNGEVKAFAFVFNGKADQGDTVRHLFDALATELAQ